MEYNNSIKKEYVQNNNNRKQKKIQSGKEFQMQKKSWSVRDHAFKITLRSRIVIFILNDCDTDKMKKQDVFDTTF